MALSFISLCIAYLCSMCGTGSSIESVVHTSYGPIEGKVTPMIRQFLSVPYAAPSNETRWRAPEPHESWTATLQTRSVPPGCPQQCTSNIPNMLSLHTPFQTSNVCISISCPAVLDENCLFLNIFTPLSDDYSSTNYPVIFYIHGGGFLENYGYGIRMNTTFNANTTNTV